MNHKMWDHTNVWYDQSLELIGEHNSLYADWKQSSLEAERLAKVNSDLCDKIAELERPIRVDSYTDIISGHQIFGSMENVKAVKKIFSDLRDTNRETLDENNRLDRELDEARQALKRPIRVPFSDEVIEKMAEAVSDARADRYSWPNAIRAALAAGGLEPCAVPEYAPEDVAFSGERASDEELTKLVWATLHGQYPRMKPYSYASALEQGISREVSAAVRAHVEAPLLAEIAEHRRHVGTIMSREAELKRELKAANARVAELEAQQEIQTGYNLEWSQRIESQRAEIDTLRAELRAVTAERDAAQAECKHLNAVIADMQPVDADAWKAPLELTAPNKHKIKIHGDGDAVSIENTAYMVNTTVGVVLDPSDAARVAVQLASYAAAHGCPVVLTAPTATPTDAQVEALARVLQRAYMKECYVDANECTPNAGYLAEARAAYAHIGRGPVGAELDVTADVIEVIARSSSRQTRAKEILDLCRSRIRPTFECKECEQWKAYGVKMEDNARVLAKRLDKTRMSMDAARAALEGE